MIQALGTVPEWDVCIIGGGATGLGIAVDAATRGLKTVLFEQHDFAKSTSSRSTKLVHGGVRYLQQGNIKLVLEALRERGLLLKNAPHLVKNQKFVVPNYKWWEGPFYSVGLKIYDWMSGKHGFGSSQSLSKKEILELAPTLDPKGLRGGILYHDGQFDDARLAIALAQTAAAHHATVLNYFPVIGFLKQHGKTLGVKVKDAISGNEYEVKSKTVVNATGIFTDTLLHMDDPDHEKMVSHSQGIHLVVDKEFLPGEAAIMIPRTDDGRVLFAVPWHNKIVLGTTDTPVDQPSLEPVPMPEEIDFILKHIGRYLSKDPQTADIKSTFAGLRPLVKGKSKKTANLSRDHIVTLTDSGLITITGGKWTTYRKMAEDVVELAIEEMGIKERPAITKNLLLYGFDQPVIPADPTSLTQEQLKAAVVKSIHEESCITVEDFLSRRTRLLLLDALKAMEMAPTIAAMMATEKDKDESWIKNQIKVFTLLAKNYLPPT